MIAHLFMPSPTPAHLQNLSILLTSSCMLVILDDKITKSIAYASELIVVFEVLEVYSKLSLSNHLNSSSKKTIKKHGLRVLPYIVPLWMDIGLDFVKCVPINVV